MQVTVPPRLHFCSGKGEGCTLSKSLSAFTSSGSTEGRSQNGEKTAPTGKPSVHGGTSVWEEPLGWFTLRGVGPCWSGLCYPCRWPGSPAPRCLQYMAQQPEAPRPSALFCTKVSTPSTLSVVGPLALEAWGGRERSGFRCSSGCLGP